MVLRLVSQIWANLKILSEPILKLYNTWVETHPIIHNIQQQQ